MTTVTVAVPFRAGALDREIHADYVTARLRELIPEARHLRVDVDGQFSRAAVRNEAVRQAGGGVVVLCDADTLPEAGPLRDAIAGAAGDGLLHLPYTTYRALSAEGTLAVYARGLDPHHAPAAETSRRPIGGVWVITADAYWAAGGMDESFVGWGFEDDAFWTAATTLLGAPVRHHGVITHLRHDPAVNTRSAEYRRNRGRYQTYLRARSSPTAMRALVGIPEEAA
ncbi:galactosyltransferase-related protein [Nocardia sp. NPDC051981]|uniref:glycosyltransferase family 2 protein n=1 Tax=Nocardia sp. NPDC051981 TaxID=3155417 RepID=UPI00343671C2